MERIKRQISQFSFDQNEMQLTVKKY
jgi:hypothetical protein